MALLLLISAEVLQTIGCKSVIKKLWLLCLFLIVIPISNLCAGTNTVNGIPIETTETNRYYLLNAQFFTDFTFGTATKYNEGGSSTAAGGLLDIRDYQDFQKIIIDIGTVSTSGTLTIRIEQFVGTNTISGLFSGSTRTYSTSTIEILNLGGGISYLAIGAYDSTSTTSSSGSIWANFFDKKLK